MLQYMLDYIISILILFQKQQKILNLYKQALGYLNSDINQHLSSFNTMMAYLNTKEHIGFFKWIGSDNFSLSLQNRNTSLLDNGMFLYIFMLKDPIRDFK